MCSHSSDKKYRIVVMGSAEVGKSSVVQRLLNREYSDGYIPTVEALYPLTEEKPTNCEQISIEILDTAGAYNFPDMQRIYISSANVILLVFSADNYDSFKEVLRLIEVIGKQIGNKMMDIHILAVSAKSDIDPYRHKITLAEAELELMQWNIPVVETSAKENTGFDFLRSLISAYIGKMNTGCHDKPKHRLSRLLSKITKSKSADEDEESV
ncbi:GTP-binding protein drn-1-like [Anneissia japonica]|uniref:GTP-binding protein drn-1-like n=1 Tax=Anneissia japonica TaxID=1529436 RepID=UPI001425AEE5|nr:GTP-binding protein drn-1-like [Anneissia japonica]